MQLLAEIRRYFEETDRETTSTQALVEWLVTETEGIWSSWWAEKVVSARKAESWRDYATAKATWKDLGQRFSSMLTPFGQGESTRVRFEGGFA